MGKTLISLISSLLSSSPLSALGLLFLSHKDGDLIKGLLVLWEGRRRDKRDGHCRTHDLLFTTCTAA
jgi:hypothetical protein